MADKRNNGIQPVINITSTMFGIYVVYYFGGCAERGDFRHTQVTELSAITTATAVSEYTGHDHPTNNQHTT